MRRGLIAAWHGAMNITTGTWAAPASCSAPEPTCMRPVRVLLLAPAWCDCRQAAVCSDVITIACLHALLLVEC